MRDKLIELLNSFLGGCEIKDITPPYGVENLADYLISHGVTLQQWIPVSERLPEPFVSVLVHMPEERPCPTVYEGFLTKNGALYAAHFEREHSEVTHWMPLPEPPKDVEA